MTVAGAGNGGTLSGLVASTRDAMTVSRVFGEAYERDGVTVIPVATVRGGAGGGSGRRQDAGEEGDGGGFGVAARPAGAYVIKGSEVSWLPAVDVNRIVALGVAGWIAVAWIVVQGTRRRRRR